MFINVGVIINIIIFIQLFKTAAAAGLHHNISGLCIAIGGAFIMTVWPFARFKQIRKPEDMDDKGV
jgi:hypothetical protein